MSAALFGGDHWLLQQKTYKTNTLAILYYREEGHEAKPQSMKPQRKFHERKLRKESETSLLTFQKRNWTKRLFTKALKSINISNSRV
jgi:hypothetical protein